MKKIVFNKNIKPIYIFFHEKDIPSELKFSKGNEINFPKNFIFEKNGKILVFLNQINNLNKLQKNYYLIVVGEKLYKFCKSGRYKLSFFGDKSLRESNVLLGWKLASYRFQKFKISKKPRVEKDLFHKSSDEVKKESECYFFIRDLINLPANILGPKEIFSNAKSFLKGASSKLVSGKMLKKNFPLISAVGQGSSKKNQPLFCEFKFKRKSKRKIIIIGKGVSFDTGGLNLKTGSGMSLMKKDMGGAANSIGLAKLININETDVDLRLFLCLVENSISQNSIRPSDIYKSRDGKYVEVGDTDAEGRLILADALTYASEQKPDLIINLATLTGASRVALGTDVPSFFSNDDSLAMELIDASQEVGDPLWQLPLWDGYKFQLSSTHADIKNIGNSMFGGAITAALFLSSFVKSSIPWIHVDLMAWSKSNKFSNYDGGEAMGIRAISNLIKKRFI